ncbi:MAG: purine-binding chemotaxis protein CheW [Deltaproteobacteria bacterium]|nr:purine-binding chemotaxis protein CheW [Deltaproteobacteria bacterium]
MTEETPSAKPLREMLAEAADHDSVADAEPELELFCMDMGGERFAVEAALVHEVVRLPTVTPLPGSPPFLLGVCAHRGEVLPVVDLPRLMGRGEARAHNRSRMAVVRFEGMVVALLADQIEGLTRIKSSLLEPAPMGATQRGAEFLAGVSSDPLGNFALLDLKRLVQVARNRAGGGS